MISAIDNFFLRAVLPLRRGPLTRAFILLTQSGTGTAWLAAALAFNILHAIGVHVVPAQPVLLRAMIAPLVAWPIGSLIKRVVGRARPPEAVEGYTALVAVPTCRSFPSSHAATSIAFASALLIFGHPLAPWVTAWAVLVSFSRIYLGVHYPSDVLGGALLGAGCAAIAVPLVRAVFG
jgi:membrane-associated phospholipid phosphatase